MDLLFPPTCAGCGYFSARFCSTCYSSVDSSPQINVCPCCGNKLVSGKCIVCTENHFVIHGIKSWGIYKTSLKQAVIQLKFHRNIALGDEFSRALKKIVLDSGWPVDLIIPVPISSQRLMERGYNQAAILAYPLALSLNIPYLPDALLKHRESRSQIGLSYSERMNNIQDSFKAKSKKIKNKSILVIDDVTTTGATLNACALALINGGAKSVYGLSLAKAIIRSNRQTACSRNKSNPDF